MAAASTNETPRIVIDGGPLPLLLRLRLVLWAARKVWVGTGAMDTYPGDTLHLHYGLTFDRRTVR